MLTAEGMDEIDKFVEVEAIPILGTGKLDLAKIKLLAKERLT